jgi:hypothetical protein
LRRDNCLYILMPMGNLNHIADTVLATIQSIGYVSFGIMVVVNIVLYRLHPVLGFLGTLFLFALLTGLIH